MKLKKFKERDNKRIGIIVFTVICILLVSGVMLYRTFAIFEVKTNQNVIKGTVQDPGNIYFAFYKKREENADFKIQKDMPKKEEGYVLDEEQSYCGINGNTEENVKVSLTEDWRILVSGVTTSRTKCNLYFTKGTLIMGHGIPVVTSGDGLYEVTHEDVKDTTNDTEFSKSELRYAGSNPKNYVWFNEELWRMIGLVNVTTSEPNVEQRIKIVKKESIGILSWDHKNQWGSNDWTNSHLMELLNGIYYNSQIGSCWSGEMFHTGEQKNCDFSSNSKTKGLSLRFQEMVDKNIEWNIGESSAISNILGTQYYSYERSNVVNADRENFWTKENTKDSNNSSNPELFQSIGLIYPSDYVYSTSGGNNMSQKECVELPLRPAQNQENIYSKECSQNNWLKPQNGRFWTLMTNSEDLRLAYEIDGENGIVSDGGHTSYDVYPALYLKTNVKIIDGLGTEENPYKLALIS